MSVAGANSPFRRHLRSARNFCFDASVASMKIEHIEAPPYTKTAVSSLSVQRPVQPVGFDMAIAGGEPGLAAQAVDIDAAVTGMNIGAQLTWDIQLDAYGVLTEIELKVRAGNSHFEFHPVAQLMIDHGYFPRPDLPASSVNVRLDLLPVPGSDGYRSIVGVHAQVGTAANREFLGPIVREKGGAQKGAGQGHLKQGSQHKSHLVCDTTLAAGKFELK